MDRREQRHWWSQIDEKRMRALPRWLDDTDWQEDEDHDGEVPEVSNWIPVVFVICGTCDGKGKHVNPSIDSHGLSGEDFDRDPDFAEDYFSGLYDVPCNECNGRRVSIVVDRYRATEDQQKAIQDYYDDEAEDAAIRRMENGYGY